MALLALIPIVALAFFSFSVVVVTSLRHEDKVIARHVALLDSLSGWHTRVVRLRPFDFRPMVVETAVTGSMPRAELINVINIANYEQSPRDALSSVIAKTSDHFHVIHWDSENLWIVKMITFHERDVDYFSDGFIVLRRIGERFNSNDMLDQHSRNSGWRIPVIAYSHGDADVLFLDRIISDGGFYTTEQQSGGVVRHRNVGAFDSFARSMHAGVNQ